MSRNLSALLFLFIFILVGCGKPNSKQLELDSCISQAVSLFSRDKPVDRAWHVVGCMESKGYKSKFSETVCKNYEGFQ
ncbi:MAG: hypothetical protein ACI8PW_001247 [Methylophilaceae bacterium]|jgi:hypothetical protein